MFASARTTPRARVASSFELGRGEGTSDSFGRGSGAVKVYEQFAETIFNPYTKRAENRNWCDRFALPLPPSPC